MSFQQDQLLQESNLSKNGSQDQTNQNSSDSELSQGEERQKSRKKKRKRSKLTTKTSKRNKKVPLDKNFSLIPIQLRECSWIINSMKNLETLKIRNAIKKKERELRRQQAALEQVEAVPVIEDKNCDRKKVKGLCKCCQETPTKVKPQKKIEVPRGCLLAIEDHQLVSLDQVANKFYQGYYHNADLFMQDLQIVVENTIKTRCRNWLSKAYCSYVFFQASEIVYQKYKEFKTKWVTFYDNRLKKNQERNQIIGNGDPNVWYKQFDESTKRQYKEIQDYAITVPGRQPQIKKKSPPKMIDSVSYSSLDTPTTNGNNIESPVDQHQKCNDHLYSLSSDCNETYLEDQEIQKIKQIMKTQKTSACDGSCCLEKQKINSITIQGQLVSSMMKCSCAQLKMECSSQCACDPIKCQNRQMSNKQSLRLGIDVEERVSWGMDTCTAVNFITVCPKDMDLNEKSIFVQKKLSYAIQQQNERGFDVTLALKYIINANLDDQILQKKFTKADKRLAGVILAAIQNLPTRVLHFRIHSKGLGIFCKRVDGIEGNSLVVEYFGEIYKPWHWFEKQDIIKQGQNQNKLPKELPDFYNIIFERHMDDPSGYNILIVDPILFGNFSSRLSHSCTPNCQTMNKVRLGQFSIGMFTNKNIEFGEELCFDYCSSTESEKEYEQAICLCGTAYCKGRFLTQANDKKNLAIMREYHTFIDRNYLIYKAVLSEKIETEELERLHRNSLNASALDGLPVWLQKWASYVCEYLEFEEEIFPDFFKSEYPSSLSREEILLDAKLQKETQIQNIAITIDKVMHVLQLMGTTEPPIIALSFKERFHRIWISQQFSLRQSLIQVLQPIKNIPQVQKVINNIENAFQDEMYNKIGTKQNSSNSSNSVDLLQFFRDKDDRAFEYYFNKARNVLSQASKDLREVNTTQVAIAGLCDILEMHAATENYFQQNQNYKKSRSQQVIVRKCDVKHKPGDNMEPESQATPKLEQAKEYDSQFVWGQLVGWFKQTVDKPNASLSSDRRGTLTIPELQSFSNEDNKFELIPQKQKKDVKLKLQYPNKRFKDRNEFLLHWPEMFAKQWDICCGWNFCNKMKMYGSVQLESLIKADKPGISYDNFMKTRIDYLKEVANYLIQN